MKDKRPPYSKISVQPGERFLASIGYDYWNTESSARRVAEEAEKKIIELENQIAAFLEEEGCKPPFGSCLPELKD